MLASFLCGEFILHIPCSLHFYVGSSSYTSSAGFIFYLGSFSYTSHDGIFFIWGVSLTHLVLALIWSADFLLHIPCSFHFYQGSFSYKSHAAFIVGSFSYTFCAGLIFIWGVSLTHPMQVSFFILGSFSYTSHAGFIVIWGVSLTHTMLD